MSAEKPQAASGAPAGAATPDPTDGTPIRYWLVVGPFGRIHSGHPTRDEAAAEQACIGEGNPYRVVEAAPVVTIASECIRIAERCAWTNPGSKYAGPELNAMAVGEAIAEEFGLVRRDDTHPLDHMPPKCGECHGAGCGACEDTGAEGPPPCGGIGTCPSCTPDPPATRVGQLTAEGVGEASPRMAVAAYRDLADACEATEPAAAGIFRAQADAMEGWETCGVCCGSGRLCGGSLACNECGTTGRVKKKRGREGGVDG